MPRQPAIAPDLASLELLSSVVELGSLKRAAEAHGIAQPSASERIRRLERQLGVGLLHRGPGGSVPTDAGLLVVEWGATLLAAGQQFTAAVESLRMRRTSHLRVAASLTVAEFLLPGWLVQLRAAHGTVAALEVTNSARVIARVQQGEADLGFIESGAGTPGLAAKVVGIDRLVLIVARGHPFARRRRPLDAALVAATPMVTREAGSGTREVFERALRQAGFEPAEPELELASTTAVKSAVAAGTAPAVLSRLAVESELAAGSIVALELDGLDLTRRLRAVWRRGHAPEGSAAALLRIAAAAAGAGTAGAAGV